MSLYYGRLGHFGSGRGDPGMVELCYFHFFVSEMFRPCGVRVPLFESRVCVD